jgi:RNA polymerase sigma factor (sigma-70 family)
MNTILYVEDEEDYQLLVQKILAKAGLTLHIAGTGEEGLSALERLNPDLLILDINLPDTDGFTLCRQIRRRPEWATLPILMLTVRRRPEEWLQGFASGANDYVPKPLNPPELLERVMAALATDKEVSESGRPEYLLIQAALNGNKLAFEVLVQQYRVRLMDSLRSRGWTSTDAEDLTADAFARAYQRLAQFRGQSSFYTWLYRIAVNESQRPRWQQVGPSLEELSRGDDTLVPSKLGKSELLEGDLAAHGLQTQLRDAVSCVPRPYQQVLRWHLIQGISCQKIARRLNIPPGTVMSRLFKAKQLFRQSWHRTQLKEPLPTKGLAN